MALIENEENTALITTTVSVDAQNQGDQVKIHLVQGDYGTRRLQFVPADGGKLVKLDNVVRAKLRIESLVTSEPLDPDCVLSDGKIYFMPTKALTENADEFACQLVLLDANNQKLSSAPFRIIVHGDVYEGDAVEHTNTTVTSAMFNEDVELLIERADGVTINAGTHTHETVTADAPGFATPEMLQQLEDLEAMVGQDLTETATPTFAGLTVGNVIIHADGTIEGLRFT